MPSQEKKVLFIVLDAFRHDYINPEDTPFLYSKISFGIYAEKLKSVTGFTQRAAIYTGTTGEESITFTMHTFDAEHSPFQFLRHDPRLKKFLRETPWWFTILPFPEAGRIKSLLRHRYECKKKAYLQWIKREAAKYAHHAPIAYIPLQLLPEIGISEDNLPIYKPGAFKQESIFDVFANNHISFEYLMYPVVDGNDTATMKALVEKKDTGAKILFALFSDTDTLIHKCGPSSIKRREITRKVDKRLQEIASCYDNASTNLIIIGDHGMTDVIEEINIPLLLEPLERQLNISQGRDYLLFLDSTMARFKWKTNAGKEFFEKVKQLPILAQKGRFIDEQIAREYSIPINSRYYGDLIWWANTGVLLFPDYFHDQYTHDRGMHGYDSNHNDMKGFFLAFGSDITPRRLEEINLIDVCPTICDAVGAPYPAENRGVSILG